MMPEKVFSKNGPLFVYFLSFQTIISEILQQINVKSQSSIRRQDLNPQTLNNESSPIPTIPGLRPNRPEIVSFHCFLIIVTKHDLFWQSIAYKS